MRALRKALRKRRERRQALISGLEIAERRARSGIVPMQRYAELLAVTRSKIAKKKLDEFFLTKTISTNVKIDALKRILAKNAREAFRIARNIALEPKLPLALRKSAVRVLTKEKQAYAASVLRDILADRIQPTSLREECAKVLAFWPSPSSERILLRIAKNKAEPQKLRKVCLRSYSEILKKRLALK